MLRFSFLGFPIAIHWSFWVVSALLNYQVMELGGTLGLQLLLMWVAVVLVSIVWHELGHALAFRKYGYRPSIQLAWLGGYASAPAHLTRREDLIISAAGPAASLLLGGAIWVLDRYWWRTAPRTFQGEIIGDLLLVNIGWAVLNLFPILPLDGGRIFHASVGYDRPGLTYKVGFVASLVVAIVGFVLLERLFIAMLFGFMAYENFQRSRGLSAGFGPWQHR